MPTNPFSELYLQENLNHILSAYLLHDTLGLPCHKHPPELPYAFPPPLPLACAETKPRLTGLPPQSRVVVPDLLLKITNGAVLKYNRSLLCIDTASRQLICHPYVDSVFSQPRGVWQPSLSRIAIARNIRLFGQCLLLDARYGKEFYHFSASVLGRLHRYISFGNRLQDIEYFLLPEPAPYIVTWADRLRIPVSKRIHLQEGDCVTCSELVVPSDRREMDRSTVAFLSNTITTNPSCQTRKLFISRNKSINGRHLHHENDLIQDVLRPRGYEVLQLEDYSLEQQAQLFSEARVVAGVHGAGFTNLVHARRGVRLFELFSDQWISFCFGRLARMVGGEAYYHVASSEDKNIRISSNTLAQLLDMDELACLEQG